MGCCFVAWLKLRLTNQVAGIGGLSSPVSDVIGPAAAYACYITLPTG